KFEDVKYIKERSSLAENVAFFTSRGTTLEYENYALQNVGVYGVSSEYNSIQTIDIAYGRYFTEAELQRGSPVTVIGYNNAQELFGTPDRAAGKTISFDGHRAIIIGVMQKQ